MHFSLKNTEISRFTFPHIFFSISNPMTHYSPQPFTSGRQVVVERHSREEGLRKDWHGSTSQGGGFPDNRRMGDARGSMAPTRYTKYTISRDS